MKGSDWWKKWRNYALVTIKLAHVKQHTDCNLIFMSKAPKVAQSSYELCRQRADKIFGRVFRSEADFDYKNTWNWKRQGLTQGFSYKSIASPLTNIRIISKYSRVCKQFLTHYKFQSESSIPGKLNVLTETFAAMTSENNRNKTRLSETSTSRILLSTMSQIHLFLSRRYNPKKQNETCRLNSFLK